ncbi:MAG: SsrA-binding protein [Omnitrophica WOR_2 bacterium RIFCSPLOWO2_12_FULL_51_24]|nr:MAG: SsrA-binding protein [Omnitrophica WOR_2 bacterium RIFCSPHIGHO2_01_FULL_49_10]OGX34603.1 MAG: SsrA-binding protein [Omnitrophica WOR_2 bacterium RIFCSPLOWO2_02_FULL_50_19]OGX42624.1 MAG: SsrA-binding protein [Omnitrophica WOR_2 bacterium RIFCSPLOWO2_12_FULL_51_24]
MADETVASNREARHNYHILETFEAGIVLQGAEVKSLRDKKANLKDSFARIEDNELFLYNMHISPYPQAGRFAPDPKRRRKLLMHKPEIKKLFGGLTQKGLTLVPLKMYFKRGMAKVEIALVKGKKLYDKREDIKRHDADRDLRRQLHDK